MNSLAHRALALLILLLTLATLTGAVATVQTLAGHGGSDVCCGQTAPAEDQEQETIPCAAECSCTSCLTLLQPTLIHPPTSLTASLPGRVTLANLHLCAFISSIDYPPEIV